MIVYVICRMAAQSCFPLSVNIQLPQQFFLIQILVGVFPLPAILCFDHCGTMLGKQPHDVVHIDPDLGIALLLAFIEHQLQAKVQMHRLHFLCLNIRCVP